jgi:hypothetical protein
MVKRLGPGNLPGPFFLGLSFGFARDALQQNRQAPGLFCLDSRIDASGATRLESLPPCAGDEKFPGLPSCRYAREPNRPVGPACCHRAPGK